MTQAEATTTTRQEATPRGAPWPRRLLVAALVLTYAVLLVAIQSRHHDEIASPDEPAQLDYVLSLPHVPATGDQLREDALHGLSSEGLADGSYSTAGATPPLYYVATAVVARPVAAVTGWSVLSVARWTGVAWLALFVAVAAALGRSVGASGLAAAGAAGFAAASNSLATSAAYLGSDTAGAAVAGLILLTAWRYDGSRRALLLLAGAGALAGLTKLSAATAVAVAVVVLLARTLRRGDDRETALSRGAAVRAALVAVAAFAVPAVAWVVRTHVEAEVPRASLPSLAPYAANGVDWSASYESLLVVWDSPLGHMWAGDLLFDRPNAALTYVMSAFLVLGVLAAAFTFHRTALAGLGWGLAATMCAGPFVLTWLVFLLDSVQQPVEPRFGLGLLAGMVASGAWLLRDRPGSWVLVALAVMSVANLAV